MTTTPFTQPDSADPGTDETTYKAQLDQAIMLLAVPGAQFNPHAQDTPDLTVRIDAGAIVNPVTAARTVVAAQSTSAISAPSGNPRYDIVYVDRETGAAGIAAGSEAASPSDPTLSIGQERVARIKATVGMTEITDADLDDIRDLRHLGLPFGASANDIVTLNGSGQLPAVDGSLLTGLTTGDQTARDMAAAALALADAAGVAGTKGPFYLADPFTSDSLAVSTNAAYDSANDWYEDLDQTTDGLAALTGDGGTGSDYCFRIKIPASAISAPAGSRIKLNLRGPGSGNLVVDDCYVGQYAGSGNAWDYDGNQVRVTFGGSNGATIAAGTTQETDTVSFVYDGVSDLIVAYNAGASSTPRQVSASGYNVYYKASSNEAGTTAPTGFTASANVLQTVEDVTISAVTDPTYEPTAGTLDTADPTDLMGYFIIDPVDSLTMGTDVVGTLSIDGGTTEATGSWTKIGDFGTQEMWRLDADVSAQSGSSVWYSLTGANTKDWKYVQSVGVVPIY